MICCRHSGPWSSCNRATGRFHIVSYAGEGLTGTESIVVSLVLGQRHGRPRLSPAAWSCRMTSQPLAEALEEAFQHCRDMDASLRERLEALADAVRTLSPSFAETVDQLIARLQQSDAGATAPRPGDPIPPFLLPDETGRLVSLDTLLSNGPVAVTFHRGHWCPYCRINTDALAKAQKDIAAEGSQIVAIMPDRQQFAAEFKSALKAPFPVLTDLDNGYALCLNL